MFDERPLRRAVAATTDRPGGGGRRRRVRLPAHVRSFAARSTWKTFYSGLPAHRRRTSQVLQFLTRREASVPHGAAADARSRLRTDDPSHSAVRAPRVCHPYGGLPPGEHPREVRRWQQREHRRPTTGSITRDWPLELPHPRSPTAANVEAHSKAPRDRRIHRVLRCDLKQPFILGRPAARYPVVGAFYCTEEVGICPCRAGRR